MITLGRFIVVEGLEGSGKSTAIQTIKQYLDEFVLKTVMTREPGGTQVGEQVRALIKGTTPPYEHLDPRAELLLLYAARVQLLEQVIRPALAQGSWVIADRFELSTYAYQGGGRHLSLDMISRLSDFCLNHFKPDLILFLDIDPGEGLSRAKKRSEADRIEQESLSFFTDVYNSYHQMISTMDNVIRIDASLPVEQVQQAIIMALKHFIDRDEIRHVDR